MVILINYRNETIVDKKVAYLFLDLETTGLDGRTNQITEIGWIFDYKNTSVENQAFVKHSQVPDEYILKNMDYIDRILKSWPKHDLKIEVDLLNDAIKIAEELVGKGHVYLVGANPTFDHSFLKSAGVTGYSYHLIDVETLTMQAFHLSSPPGLYKCIELLGVPPNELSHSAMGDVRATRNVFYALRAIL